jgi:hypothetical protein
MQQFANPPFNAALTLWVGDLPMEIDESFLWGVFNVEDQVVSVKLIRGKAEVTKMSGLHVACASHQCAVRECVHSVLAVGLSN